MFKGALTVTLKKSYHPKLFVLTNPLIYEGSGLRVNVPAGFDTDLASIPWFARWIFARAHSNAYAAVVHDYLYAKGFTSRSQADGVFFEALKDPVCSTRLIARCVMWAAVRVGGWRGWNRARANDQLKLKDIFDKTSQDGGQAKGLSMAQFERYQGFEKPKRKVDTVHLHCSDHDNPKFDNPQEIDRWHKARGWSGIGYHFYIDKLGNVFHGRSLERIPAAQAPFNRRSIAICCGGRKKEKFTSAQFDALRRLCADIDAAYGGDMVFKGHCEVSPKTCPVFDYKRVLRLDKNGRIMDGVPTIKKLEASKSKHMKAAKAQTNDGDLAVSIGTGIVVKTTWESSKDLDLLNTLKEITAKGADYKAIIVKANELIMWAFTFDGLMIGGGAIVMLWGWRKWRAAEALKQARLSEEPKLKRLQREAIEAYG